MPIDEGTSRRKKERWIVASFFCLSGILAATWSSRIPDIQQKLGLNNAALGAVLFAIPVGLMTGLTVASWLVTTLGTKKIMLVGCILLSLVLIMVGVASTTTQLMLALFFMGLVRTVFNLSINTSSIELQRLYDRPIVASFHGIWSLACFVAAGIGTVMIILNVGPFYHFLWIGVLIATLAFVLIGKKGSSPSAVERRPFFVRPDKYLFLLGLIALCTMLCESAMFEWSVNYFDQVVKAKRSMVTIGYTSFIIAMAFGRLVGDRFIASMGIYRMLMINGLLMSAGFALAAFFPFVVPAALGLLLIGLGDSILVPVVYMLAARSQKMPSAYALSSVTLIGHTGFVIGPLFIGSVSEKWGMSVAFLCLALISMLIIILAVQVRKLPA